MRPKALTRFVVAIGGERAAAAAAATERFQPAAVIGWCQPAAANARTAVAALRISCCRAERTSCPLTCP